MGLVGVGDEGGVRLSGGKFADVVDRGDGVVFAVDQLYGSGNCGEPVGMLGRGEQCGVVGLEFGCGASPDVVLYCS